MITKEILLWLTLYGVYWYVSCIVGNSLWDLTKLEWINDITRTFGPVILLGITYIILKLKNKIEGKNQTVKVSENKFIVNSLKILGICLGAFFTFIILMFLYLYFLYFFETVIK